MPKVEILPRFSHVGIYVSNIERQADFYARVLGLTITDRGRLGDTDLVFLSRDPAEHHEVVLASGRPADLAFNAINQISFRVDSLAVLRALHARLKDEKVTEIHPISHGNAWSVYFRDPEGNRIELFVDAPWHTPQPYREPLDLLADDAEIMRRTEAECRARPGFKTRAAWRTEMARRMRSLK
jgi:catechol 2,3-dioxygenase-like lactoylglutathione lyase family enzyme